MVCLINVRANKRPDKQPATESERARDQERETDRGREREGAIRTVVATGER